jgi:hypothetical protein
MLFNHKYYSATEQNGGSDVVITERNYEHYFLMYIDGELSEMETRLVETFIDKNPIYKKEFDILLHTKLEIDNIEIDKNSLLKTSDITIKNYENYFLLSVDNELNNEEIAKLQSFLLAIPTLQKELDVMQNTKLTETAFSFNKSSLLKTIHPLFGENNIAEILTQYIDKETSVAQNIALEQLVYNDASLKNEIALLQKTILQKEEIIYPYKKQLLRQEAKAARIIPIWLRYAAAACLLLSTTLIIGKNYFGKKQLHENAVAKVPATKNTTIDVAKDSISLSPNNFSKENFVSTQVNINNTKIVVATNPLQKNNFNEDVNMSLKQKNDVTILNEQRTTINNDVANKKVLTQDKVISNKDEVIELPLETVAISKVTLNETVINVNETEFTSLTSNKILSNKIADNTNDDVTIMGIDVDKIDKKGNVKKAKSKFATFVQKKINAISNGSIDIGKYEIALAK